ncbi:MAG: histidine kinase [Oscillospiraceae bacterium]
MELIENLLQLLVTFAGACLAGFAYWEKQSAEVFSAVLLLRLLRAGRALLDAVSAAVWRDAACVLCVGIRLGGQHDLPAHFAGNVSGPDERAFRCRVVWLAPLVGVPLMVFYCTYGDILSNLIWCGMMIALSFCSIRGLAYARRQTGAARDMRHFHTAVLCFAASEYLLWTAGCFWQNDSLASPAFWCDILLTLAILGLLPATRKAVRT